MKNIKKYLMLIPILTNFGYNNAMYSPSMIASFRYPNPSDTTMDNPSSGNGIKSSSSMSHDRVVSPEKQQELNNKLIESIIFSDDIAVQRLIFTGADVNAVNKSGQTPLIKAAASNNTEIAKILMNNGANVNAVDKMGITPLIWAVKNNSPEMVDALIQEGRDDINVDCISMNEETPLILAAINNNSKIATMLINAGANPTFKTTRKIDAGAQLIDSKANSRLQKFGHRKFTKDIMAHQCVLVGTTPDKKIENQALQTKLENYYNEWISQEK